MLADVLCPLLVLASAAVALPAGPPQYVNATIDARSLLEPRAGQYTSIVSGTIPSNWKLASDRLISECLRPLCGRKGRCASLPAADNAARRATSDQHAGWATTMEHTRVATGLARSAVPHATRGRPTRPIPTVLHCSTLLGRRVSQEPFRSSTCTRSTELAYSIRSDALQLSNGGLQLPLPSRGAD
jgi:hypothetical protein